MPGRTGCLAGSRVSASTSKMNRSRRAWHRNTPAGKSRARSSLQWVPGRCGPPRAAKNCSRTSAIVRSRSVCVGVLETSKLPPEAVCVDIAEKCGIAPDRLTLLAARTSSMAGTVQIVARSVETALHKLHVLGFDFNCIESGLGHRAAAAGCRRRSGSHRSDQRRHSLRRVGESAG